MHAKRLEEARRIRRALGVGGGAALVLLVLLQLGGREAYTRDPGDGGYGAGTGEHRVRVADSIEIRDQSRAKNLQVKAYYPEDQGRYPVIVFSHGALGSKNGYEPLVRHWASQGYVVILPTHDDSLSLRRSSGERKTLREEISDPEAWQNRPKDVSLVLDSLGEIERRAPGLVGRMDTSRIGVGGHSYGAFTAMAAGGATIDIPNGSSGLSLADPRVRAVLALSPQGAGQMGLTRDSWKNLSAPMMSVTGSRDAGFGGQPASWRREPFDGSPSGGKYFVWIDGAAHSLGGVAGAAGLGGGADKAILGYVLSTTTAFWNAYLKDDGRALSFLQSNRLPTQSRGKVRIERK